jgi:hypothetical protein
MASDVESGKIPIASVAQGREATRTGSIQPESGKSLPPSGKTAAPAPTRARAAGSASSAQTLVDLLNRNLNDSGRPDQYRVDPASNNKLIQQINPANGEVIGEFPVNEFPALARSVGVSGLLVDSLA